MKPRTSTIVEQLECPHCAIRVDGFDPEVFRGIQECYKRRCRQRWWAMRFARGEVRPQLADVFGVELAPGLMRTWALPAIARTPLFWQLSLTRNQSDQMKASGSRMYLRLIVTLDQLRGAGPCFHGAVDLT